MTELEKLITQIIKFAGAGKLNKIKIPKTVAGSLILEAIRILRKINPKNIRQLEAYINKNRKTIPDELSDALYGLFLVAHDANIDIAKALDEEQKIHEKKKDFSKK